MLFCVSVLRVGVVLWLLGNKKEPQGDKQADQRKDIQGISKPAWISGTMKGCLGTGIIKVIKGESFLHRMVEVLADTKKKAGQADSPDRFRLCDVCGEDGETHCDEHNSAESKQKPKNHWKGYRAGFHIVLLSRYRYNCKSASLLFLLGKGDDYLCSRGRKGHMAFLVARFHMEVRPQSVHAR